MPTSGHRPSVAFGTAVGCLGLALWWLVQGETSPLRGYFLYHVGFGNFLAKVNLPAILVGILVSGNVHQPSEIACFIAMFVQWFVVGWFTFVVVSWFRSRRSKYAS